MARSDRDVLAKLLPWVPIVEPITDGHAAIDLDALLQWYWLGARLTGTLTIHINAIPQDPPDDPIPAIDYELDVDIVVEDAAWPEPDESGIVPARFRVVRPTDSHLVLSQVWEAQDGCYFYVFLFYDTNPISRENGTENFGLGVRLLAGVQVNGWQIDTDSPSGANLDATLSVNGVDLVAFEAAAPGGYVSGALTLELIPAEE